MKNDLLKEVAGAVGGFIEYWGFKNIHGQIWTYLYLMKDPVAASKLREELGISKGLLSMSLNELKDYQVICSSGKGKHGVELLEANPDILEGILTVLKNREKNIINNVDESIKKFKELSTSDLEDLGVDPAKVKKLSKLVVLAKKIVNSFIKLDQISLAPWKYFRGS